jgi:hypothetical protein
MQHGHGGLLFVVKKTQLSDHSRADTDIFLEATTTNATIDGMNIERLRSITNI